MRRLRLAVLASGRGSNAENLVHASRDGRMHADVAVIVASDPRAGVLDVARRLDVPVAIAPSAGVDRSIHEQALADRIEEARADIVCLAGYMRILSPQFIHQYEGRLVNVHPSLLPAFPGLDAQTRAWKRGVRVTGCTTHFVTEEVDAGPILMQATVPANPDDTAETLAARILEAEHRIYPETIQLLATGRARWENGRVAYRDVAAVQGIHAYPEVSL